MFFKLLGEMFYLIKEQLLHCLLILKKLKDKDSPFAIGQHLMVGSEKLKKKFNWALMKNGKWTIGFIGLSETIKILIGKHQWWKS